MSIFETASKVVTYFSADVSDMKKGLKELQGEERKLREEQIKAAEDRNKGLESWVDGMGKANQALELVGKAVGFAQSAWKSYADNLRLTTAAGKTNIDDLRKASLGLRTENELLAFAAKAQHGVIKASAADMETAQRAMVALTRAGFDQDEVYQKITNSMVKAKAEGLDDFGLAIKQGKTDAETYANVMAALAEKAAGVKDGSLTGAEGVEAMGVRMHDSMEKMKQAIGRLVVALEPLLTALSKAVAFVADMAQQEMDMREKGGAAGYMVDLQMTARGMVRDPDDPRFWISKEEANGKLALRSYTNAGDVGAYRGRQAIAGFTRAGSTDSFTTGLPKLLDLLGSMPSIDPWTKQSLEQDIDRMLGKLKGGGKGDGVSFAQIGARGFDGSASANTSWLDALVKAKGGFSISPTPGASGIEQFDVSGLADEQQRAFIEEQTRGSRYEQYLKNGGGREQNESILAKTFGPIEDFQLYAKGFDMLTGAVTTSMDAWIDGSMSAGAALKKFFADALKGLANQMAVEALKHGAYALGSLAFGDIRGAGQHAAAAAAFGVGAAAAAVAAKEMGGSAAPKPAGGAGAGASGGGASGGGASTGGGNGNGKPGTTTIIYAYGDPFANDSARARSREAERMVRKVTGGNAGQDS